MGRPRFVTAMAIGACVCESWDADIVSADGITPPWLVYEWFVVEAFVRANESLAESSGIPGIMKVRSAVRNKRPVSYPSYLKTPSVFGFTGVFRRLARTIGILTEDGRLDDGGYELLAAWAKDQGLSGFVDASSGDGHDFRERLRRVVSQGMEKGYTTPQSGTFWHELARRLDPSRPGRNESKVLQDHILLRAGPVDMVDRLTNSLIAQGGVHTREDEAPFLRKLSSHAPAELKQLLTAIEVYESFGRIITDALNGLRCCASINGGSPVDAKAFSDIKTSILALDVLGPSIARIRNHPTLLEWEPDPMGLTKALDRFEGVRNGADLFAAVLDYHEQVQGKKPPNGKRSWFERVSQRKVIVRSGYSLFNPPEAHGSYVHEYRIRTFSGFLADLGVYK